MQTLQTAQSQRDSNLTLVRRPSIGLTPRQIITSCVEMKIFEDSKEGVVVVRIEPSADDEGYP
jgi:hypothetical protein